MAETHRELIQEQLELIRRLEVLRDRIQRGPVDPEDAATIQRLRAQFEANGAKLDTAVKALSKPTIH